MPPCLLTYATSLQEHGGPAASTGNAKGQGGLPLVPRH